MNILLIEDCDEDAFLFQRAFKQKGIARSFGRVSGGAEAVSYLKGETALADDEKLPFPNIIFTDLKMPAMDGFEVVKWVRSHPRFSALPVLVFSSSDAPSDVERAYRVGASAYLVKPNSFGALQTDGPLDL